MKNYFFLIIISIVLVIFYSANYYIYVRGLQAFSFNPTAKKWYTIAFFSLVSTFVAGMVLERYASSAISEWIYRIGAFWLAFMLYFFLTVVVIDLVRILNSIFHFIPPVSEIFKLRLGILVVSIVTLVVIGGYINAKTIDVRKIPLTIHKKVTGSPDVKILMASDIHLGALIGDRQEKKLIQIIGQQKPDLVLLCGDLVDGEMAPVLRKKLGKHIQEIQVPLGVYAIPGNHEYIGDIHKTLPYLKSINIRVLRDETVTLPNGIQLTGRDDRSFRNGQNGPKSLDELLKNVDNSKPVIVMLHQPYNLDEAVKANIDLQLSGHTHNGQLWPFNYITKAIFEVSWGYLKKGNTNFYVSSGYGSWGPPVRTGNRPEVVVFDIKFDNR